MVESRKVEFKTEGNGSIVDLTPTMKKILKKSEVRSGTITVFVPGSTGGITTIEYEPGLLKDIPELMEKLIPSDRSYQHDETWHDGNGFSHLRAAMIGPDITVPFTDKQLLLGRWQQVVFLDFDNKARQRSIIFQIMGDE